ncbi:MAG TPA: pyridoxal 5'-phosphate synthase glutaminase subunit PdxT [Candidatus Dormibacteraeota bacterium]|nr:pyridoxal 5'-phosphate synthase glutaminase subunit PdxT [Candidatus Dormibacteraeota bacterium]
MTAPRVGVLALQGAFREHIETLRQLGVDAFPVRTEAELQTADAVVLPGGESTTMDKLLRKFNLQQPLRQRLRDGMPALATCAGLILLAREIIDGLPDQQSLDILSISVRRNGYGRQSESFQADVDVEFLDEPFPGVFIRAPVIDHVAEEVDVVATQGGRVVGVRGGPRGSLLGLVFHPELSGDDRVHRYFIDLVEEDSDRGTARAGVGA